MYKFLTKRGQLLALLLGVAVIVIYLTSVFGGLSSAGYSVSDDLNQIMKNNPNTDFSFFNTGLGLTIGLIIFAVAIAIIFGLIQILSSPKASLKGIIGVAVIAILFFLLSSSATAETTGKIGELVQRFDISDSISKFISGGLSTTLILAGIAVVIMVLGEIWNLFK